MNYTPTSACASGGQAVGEAFRLIRYGEQDVVITGGAEAAVTPMGVGGFAVMRAMSTRNDEPTRASRPFDRDRDGFVIGEGAGILVLESLEHAPGARRARSTAEIVGYGANADAYHITVAGAGRARRGASACGWRWRAASIDPLEVDYINAHGTSTPYNDVNETQAIKRVFGEHAARLAVSSTKSMTGHLLGGAGGVEAVVHRARRCTTAASRRRSTTSTPIPSAISTTFPTSRAPRRVRVALSNSFGFGGANACLAFRRWDG